MMPGHTQFLQMFIAFLVLPQLGTLLLAEDETPNLKRKHPGWDGPVDAFFLDEVWAKIGERTCLKCHHAQGDAAESQFVLRDPSRDQRKRQEAFKRNRDQFQQMATTLKEGESRLLLKVRGDLDHGGGVVLKTDSTEYKILERFVQRVTREPGKIEGVANNNLPPFFEGVDMLSPKRLLRRTTLSLAGRLPTPEEIAAIEKEGLNAMDSLLEKLMQEEAFYDRLKEAFNDILLIRGYDGGAEGALSYEHFKDRLWYQKLDPGKLSYQHPKKKAYYELVKNYREAMLREPLELIAHIVRNDQPFTEIVTADYIMVSPYTAKGYGIFEDIKQRFRDPENPFEFIPTKIEALRARNGKQVQPSETGFYPHAGLLSNFQYLKRFPTTETNRNRLRVRMYFEHFLGIDIMQLAPRVNDAAAITEKYEVPTMQAAECVVCHKVIDPIAGLYQDYYVVDGKGIYGPRKEGWYEDMFPAGLDGQELPTEERWRSLQWLGEQTARDPRFATAVVGHVWYILSGRKPLMPPDDIDDPMFAAKHRAYRVQRDEVERIAERFVESNFNLKVVFKEWIRSQFYRADGLATSVKEPRRLTELDDVGVVRMLTPEQLERKLAAIFGKDWGRLHDGDAKLNILYGGIDSKEVTERITEPSGAMGAIQRIMANDMACRHTAADFSLAPEKRRLFPEIEPMHVPGTNAETDEKIRRAIVHLHELLLGRYDEVNDPEVLRTFNLFAGIVEEAKSRKGVEPVESYFCQTERDKSPRDPDPHYTIRAWRAVVTYLLRQHEFLYE
ncbi:MAG: DUF1592 domain-containing protein [Planctomycetaceae bacterium]|nr:DUF1592 domain-containing protein [Planctomycetaceae bacterium]